METLKISVTIFPATRNQVLFNRDYLFQKLLKDIMINTMQYTLPNKMVRKEGRQNF